MPAPKVYIGPREISNLMSISLREAQYMLKAFELKGQTIKFGRVQRVALRTFANYLSSQDGSNAADTFNVLNQALKGA